MHHWSIIACTYLYDGTIEGLLTIVYRCFEEKKMPNDIMMKEAYEANLFDQPVMIDTDYTKANQFISQVSIKLDHTILYHVYTAFLSDDKHKAKVIVTYLIMAFKHGKHINYMQSIDCVIEIQRMCKNVTGEAHRMKGFLRFRELKNHMLYAEYESDNDVLRFLAEHFRKRLKQEIWMIHDLKRQQVALYNRSEYVIVDATTMDISSIEHNQEDEYLLLWKRYFKRIAIKGRENKRCQRQFMPKKYWQYLPEMGE